MGRQQKVAKVKGLGFKQFLGDLTHMSVLGSM